MKVLITGGCGFVGRAITNRCLDMGFTVALVDNLSTGKHPDQWLPEWENMPISFYQGDVRRFFSSAPRADYDLVFHCAAVVGGRKMIDGAPLHVATDLSIDAEFFNWCCSGAKKPRKVIYFSSSAVYPVSLQTEYIHVALNEALARVGNSKIGMPDATYGWSKLSGEYLMSQAVQHYGLDCVCYRPFSGYGEDQDFSYPFPAIVRRIGRKEKPIKVWGTGEQVRDFIHIDDVVDAIFASYPQMSPGETINLGTGVPTSFINLIKSAMKVIGHSAEIETLEDQPTGVFYRVADTYLMRKYYAPKITLEGGIARAHEYQKANGLLTKLPEGV